MPAPSVLLFAENRKIKMTFDNARWPEMEITGGRLNQDIADYWKGTAPLQREEYETLRNLHAAGDGPEADALREKLNDVRTRDKEYTTMYIDSHPESYASLFLLSGRFEQGDPNELNSQFETMSPALQELPLGVELREKIGWKLASWPGRQAPDFTKTDKDGKTITLKDYRGKYVILDFWGSWCGPCRSSHPHMKELYTHYNPLGVEFIHVSREGSVDARDKWLKAIEEDGLTWTQILNDEGAETCDLVKLYCVQGFPTKVLIDPEGTIVTRELGINGNIDKALSEIFGPK